MNRIPSLNLTAADLAGANLAPTDLDLARDHYTAGQLSDAHRALHRLLAADPDSGRGWELLGLVYHAWQLWEPGAAALEEASLRVPLAAVADCAMADCYVALGKNVWARGLYRQLLHQKSATFKALLGAAAGLDLLGEPRLAVIACRRALRRDGQSAQAWFDLAYYLARCGATSEQVKTAAYEAVRLQPEQINYRIALAGYLRGQDCTQEALELLQGLSRAHIELVRCRCCLERLIELFASSGDLERAAWCQMRQEFLAMDRSHVSC